MIIRPPTPHAMWGGGWQMCVTGEISVHAAAAGMAALAPASARRPSKRLTAAARLLIARIVISR